MPVNQSQQIPVNVVGSSIFGRYPKISLEKTYNMFISDEWMVNYSGFQKVSQIFPSGEGRALFHSVRGQFLIAIISSAVYKFGNTLFPQFIGNIDTVTGEVFIDENLSNQICIVDGQSAYIYNYINNILTKQTLNFLGNPIVPNYVCYHNTFFLIGSSPTSINSQNWYAFERLSDNTIQLNTQLSLQTKPDSAIAVKRIPGRGNNVLVIGSTVCEVWTQVGGIENYRRVQSFNIDSGFVAVSTIAANEQFVCGLAQNENNSLSILFTDGSSTQRISSDGIDYLLQTIKNPQQSTAFFFRQDGHLFYQLTFFNPSDNLSLVYDFNTQKFFHLSDQDLNYHPARQIVYFNEKTYFVSLNDASIYQMGTEFISYNYNIDTNIKGSVIPRKRIPKTIRKEDSSRFRVVQFTFWIEQGVPEFYEVNIPCVLDNLFVITRDGNFIVTPIGDFIVEKILDCPSCDEFMITESNDNFIISESGNFLVSEGTGTDCVDNFDVPRVDMSFSKNGNQSFSNIVGRELNPLGVYSNQIRWWRMGQANEFTPQLDFWGYQRFVVKDGILEII